SVQIWNIDVDPAKNSQAQVLRNTGVIAPLSVEQHGDSDVFYLSDSGIRSLRARDSSTAALSDDVGTPVDDYVTQVVQAMGAAVADADAVIEPIAGRYWLALGDTVFVFSQFIGSKVAAWTTYQTPFDITAFATNDNQLVCRGDDDKLYQI